MEQIKIFPLTSKQEDSFYQLVAEYLPDSSREQLEKYVKLFSKAFLVLLYNDEVVGVAFGWDRKLQAPEDDSFVLDGIAIRHDHQRKGYGKLLLEAFELAAKKYGALSVSLGSADGYVEKFYINCGYIPTEYKYWENDSPVVEKVFVDVEDYDSYVRQEQNGFVVMRKRLL